MTTTTERRLADILARLGMDADTASKAVRDPKTRAKLAELVDAAAGKANPFTDGSNGAALVSALKAVAPATETDPPFVPPGDLDPDIDPQGMQVARDGEGNWYVVDSQTGQRLGQVVFGDAVQQAAAMKAARDTGPQSLTGDYDAAGRRTKRSLKADRDLPALKSSGDGTLTGEYDPYGRRRTNRRT